MRLIDADELFKELSEKGKEFYEYELFDSAYGISCAKTIVFISPTIDAIPIDEILKLRDELFEANQIGFEGWSKINQLITQYSTYKCDIFNTNEVSE
ncbi:MAG: hypothetical protein KBT27_09855 [Prevotellaceae bacterium]|nr:hypothetical protein [Candidatus Faecinaster equi]